MIVKNINGSGSNFPKPSYCKCNTWLEHWIINKNLKPIICRGCGSKYDTNELVGGHVKKCDSNDNALYIIPLCRSCNAKDNATFDVDLKDLVPVTTCKNK